MHGGMAVPAGWYPDPDGKQGVRYWDGVNWTEHRAAANGQHTPAARAEILQRAIMDYAGPSTRVITQTQTDAVLSVGAPVNHLVHLIITIFLCGLWIPVWILIAATSGPKRLTIHVDEQGEVLVR